MADLASSLDRAAERVAARILLDRCEARQPAPDVVDMEVDAEGNLIAPFVPDSPPLYTGPCAFSTPTRAASDNAREQLTSVPLPTDAPAKVLTPMSAPLFPAGTVVVCTASRDPELVARRFRVPESTAPGSFSVLRSTPLEVLP